MRSFCTAVLFCLFTWTSVSGYVWKKSSVSYSRQFKCDDICYDTLMSGVNPHLSYPEQRQKAKMMCDARAFGTRGVPHGFCSKFITKFFRERSLQEDIKEVIDNRDFRSVPLVLAEVRSFCSNICYRYNGR
ncbi:hypothetical protein OESDEN_15844 [Oesophagostomum dentatum]|uniref:Saposin B-type domain-containing protein n=1 Tax=Oesophagostomum dentatum TaxID=61180 RepID=A0A0B1SLN2_OESDE|nr:hypothetical protein OESDEN_15844 [Oesophagostomum dentatum]